MEITNVMRPGLQFYAEPMARDGDPTASVPKRNELYVICRDGSVKSLWDPDQPIGWSLMESGDQWFYCEKRAGADPKPCLVRYHATSENPPPGRGGAEVCPGAPIKAFCTAVHKVVAAVDETTFANEGGNLEKIARNLNPQLAACAAIAGDPDQTAAMAKFSEGKMSYAEMRALCG